VLIDILLPTYKRCVFLEKNLELLFKQINKYNLNEYFVISVSDNCSGDQTLEVLNKLKKDSPVTLNVYENKNEIYIENNQILPLRKSMGDYFMYLGDDDYLPDGYLKYVVDEIKSDENLLCIIPGFSGLYEDGSIKKIRYSSFESKKYNKSFFSVLANSSYGHQLSGLVFKRDNLLDSYTKENSNRNMYFWIYFIGLSALNGSVIYSPIHQVLVSQSNSKYWKYDESGLLIETLKNYKILFPNSRLKRLLASLVFSVKHSWRLRVGFNLLDASRAFFHIVRSKDVDMAFKLSLLGLYPYCYCEKIIKFSYRKLFGRINRD